MKDEQKEQIDPAIIFQPKGGNEGDGQFETQPEKLRQYMADNDIRDVEKLRKIKSSMLLQLPPDIHYAEEAAFVSDLTIHLVKATRNFELMELEVRWGRFRFSRIGVARSGECSPMHDLQPHSGGNYSTVYSYCCRGQKLAVKCFLKPKYEEIDRNVMRSALEEVCILKIAGALQFGPEAPSLLGCDIFEYSDCLEISMELCSLMHPEAFDFRRLRMDLRQNLLRMHSLQIIHHDIKFENICFSRQFNRYVFVDFGFSRFVKEGLGFKTESLFKGSLNHCSEEMMELFHNSQSKPIDLYFNDFNAFKVTLADYRNRELENSLFREELMAEERSYISQHIELNRLKFCLFQEEYGEAERLIREVPIEELCGLRDFISVLNLTGGVLRVNQLIVDRCREFKLHLEQGFLKFNLETSQGREHCVGLPEVSSLSEVNSKHTLEYYLFKYRVSSDALCNFLLTKDALDQVSAEDYYCLLALAIDVGSTQKDLSSLNKLCEIAVKKRGLVPQGEEKCSYLASISRALFRMALQGRLKKQYFLIYDSSISNVVVLELLPLEEIKQHYESILMTPLPYEEKLKIILKFNASFAWLSWTIHWETYLAFSAQIDQIIDRVKPVMFCGYTPKQALVLESAVEREGSLDIASQINQSHFPTLQLYYEFKLWQTYKQIGSYFVSEDTLEQLRLYDGELDYYASSKASYYHFILLTFKMVKNQFSSFRQTLHKLQFLLRMQSGKQNPYLILLKAIIELRKSGYSEIQAFMGSVELLKDLGHPILNAVLENELALIRGYHCRKMMGCEQRTQKLMFEMELLAMSRAISVGRHSQLQCKFTQSIRKIIKEGQLLAQYYLLFKTEIKKIQFYRIRQEYTAMQRQILLFKGQSQRFKNLLTLANLYLIAILMSRRKHGEALQLSLFILRVISSVQMVRIPKIEFLSFLFRNVLEPISRSSDRLVKQKHKELFLEYKDLVGGMGMEQVYFNSTSILIDIACILLKEDATALAELFNAISLKLTGHENRLNLERYIQAIEFIRYQNERQAYFSKHSRVVLQNLRLRANPYNLFLFYHLYQANNLRMDDYFFFRIFEAVQLTNSIAKQYIIQKMYLTFMLLNFNFLKSRKRLSLNRKIVKYNIKGWLKIEATSIMLLNVRRKVLGRLKEQHSIQKYYVLAQKFESYGDTIEHNLHQSKQLLQCGFNSISIVSNGKKV